jgi:hypothetical protein
MWAVLGGVALVVAVVAPGARATVLPLLLVAACPLSMVLMGVGMARAGRGTDNDAPTPSSERETVSP